MGYDLYASDRPERFSVNNAKTLAAKLRYAYGWAVQNPSESREAINEALGSLYETGLISPYMATPKAYEPRYERYDLASLDTIQVSEERVRRVMEFSLDDPESAFQAMLAGTYFQTRRAKYSVTWDHLGGGDVDTDQNGYICGGCGEPALHVANLYSMSHQWQMSGYICEDSECGQRADDSLSARGGYVVYSYIEGLER